MLMDTRRGSWRAGEGRLPVAAPRMLTERTFRPGDLSAVRRFAEAFGARAGLGTARLADFVLAVSEGAACAGAWGPCAARVRLWTSGGRSCCEVRGDAAVLRRVARGTAWPGTAWPGTAWPGTAWPGTAWQRSGRPDGPRGEEAALRRWVLKRVCDHVSVASGPDGAWVFLSMSTASA